MMTELLIVGLIVAAALGYLCRIYVLRKKSACAKCELLKAVENKQRH